MTRRKSSGTGALLQAGRDAGISMWVTAHHFTLPAWFAAMGSFGDDRVRTYSPAPACRIPRRDIWRPRVRLEADQRAACLRALRLAARGPAPGRRNLAEAARMLVGTHLANYEAWLALRGGGKPVVTIHNLSPSIPASDSEADRQAAAFVDELAFGCWIRMVRDGVLELRLPGGAVGRACPGPGVCRCLRHDRVLVLQRDRRAGEHRCQLGQRVADRGTVSARRPAGWPARLRAVERGGDCGSCRTNCTPNCLGKLLLISEYGIGTDDDSERGQFIRDGVAIAADALERGIDLRGFFHWTGVDNYEWGNFPRACRSGCSGVDRVPRPSAEVMAQFAR